MGRHVEVRPSKAQFNGESPGVSRPPRAGTVGQRRRTDRGQSTPQHGRSGGRTLAAIRSVLRIRPFRRLWIVLGVASLGDWLGLLATSIFAAAQVSGSTAKGARVRRRDRGPAAARRWCSARSPASSPTGSTGAGRWSSATCCGSCSSPRSRPSRCSATSGARGRRLGGDRHLPHRDGHHDLDAGQGGGGAQPAAPGPAGDGQPADPGHHVRHHPGRSPRSCSPALDHGSSRRCTGAADGRPGPSRPTRALVQRLHPAGHRARGVLRHQGDQRPQRASRPRAQARACCASSPRAGRTSARPRWCAAWCWASSARSPAAAWWSAPPSSTPSRSAPVTPRFYLLFAMIFIGLAIGIAARPDDRRGAVPAALVRHVASCWPARSVLLLAFAIHLSMAVVGALLRRRRRRHGLPGRHHAARRRGRRRGARPGLRLRADRHPASC